MIATKSHIEWIDGAKGVAIISVILLHSLPCLYEIGSIFYIGQAVPVFLFITAYLTSTRFNGINMYFRRERIWKLIKNVLIPFLVVLFIQLVCLAIDNRLPSFRSILKSGGVGPGSYYVWLYIQAWMILPLIIIIVRKTPIWFSMLIMLVVSILAEYVFALLQGMKYMEELYRLLPVRYMMVLYIGCLWPMLGDKQKYIMYGIACLSALFLLNDVYFVNTPPAWRMAPSYWSGYHWYTAFYVLIPIALLERMRYTEVWKQAGKYSWYIFLLQMMCFCF